MENRSHAPDERSPARIAFDERPIRVQKVRPQLEYLRQHIYEFDIAKTAYLAGVEPRAVYGALLRQPIERPDAEKILARISDDNKVIPPLTLEDVDILVYEDFLILHLVCASGPGGYNDYQFIYAKDENDVREQLKQWIELLSLTHPDIEVQPMKDGLSLHGGGKIPGYIGGRVAY